MKGHKIFVQGYNAQAVVDSNQIVIAGEVSTEPVDFSALEPLISAASRELEQANITTEPWVAIADIGFWNEQQLDKLAADGIAVLVPPVSGKRKGQRRGWSGGRYSWMRGLLASDHGRELYRQRRQVIEPVFGHTKHNRKFTQFHRRGRAAVRTEWRLLMMTHNLTKLYRHQIATAGPETAPASRGRAKPAWNGPHAPSSARRPPKPQDVARQRRWRPLRRHP
jgi:hypothetical protein